MATVYYYRSARGPGLFHQPEKFDPDTRLAWPRGEDKETPLGPWRFYGQVDYEQPLTARAIYDFELWPANPVEWARCHAWLEYREAESLWIYESYIEALQDEEQAAKLAKDTTAIVTTILIQAGISITTLEEEFKSPA